MSRRRAKVGDGAKIRRVKADHAHEVDPLARRLGDPPRRVDAVAIGVKQQRRHHRRIKRRLPELAPVGSLDLPKVKMIEDQPNDKARQVVRADKILHARRKQQRFGNLPGAECLAHPQAESDSPNPRQQNPLLSRQAPSFMFSHKHLKVMVSIPRRIWRGWWIEAQEGAGNEDLG